MTIGAGAGAGAGVGMGAGAGMETGGGGRGAGAIGGSLRRSSARSPADERASAISRSPEVPSTPFVAKGMCLQIALTLLIVLAQLEELVNVVLAKCLLDNDSVALVHGQRMSACPQEWY